MCVHACVLLHALAGASNSPSTTHGVAPNSEDSTVRVWDLRTMKSVRCMSRAFDGAAVSSVAWHPQPLSLERSSADEGHPAGAKPMLCRGVIA